MYVCMHACMHACMYVCMYVCICVYVCLYVCICVYVSIYVCMYVCMYVYVCMYACMHACMHVSLVQVAATALVITTARAGSSKQLHKQKGMIFLVHAGRRFGGFGLHTMAVVAKPPPSQHVTNVESRCGSSHSLIRKTGLVESKIRSGPSTQQLGMP